MEKNFRDIFDFKCQGVRELAKILGDLPEGHMVRCNQNNDLVILDKEAEYVGFIRMSTGEVVLFENYLKSEDANE